MLACADMHSLHMRSFPILSLCTLLRTRSSYASLSCPLSLGVKKCASLLIRPHIHIHVYICMYIHCSPMNLFTIGPLGSFFSASLLPNLLCFFFSSFFLFFFFLLCPLFFLAHLPVVLIIYVCSTSLCWCVDAVLQRRASSFVPPQSPSRVSFCPFAVFFDCIAFCCVWMRVRVYMCVHLFVLFGPLLAHFVVAVHF